VIECIVVRVSLTVCSLLVHPFEMSFLGKIDRNVLKSSQVKRKGGRPPKKNCQTGDIIRCLLCPSNDKLILANTWKTHCSKNHMNFINYRMELVCSLNLFSFK